MLLSQENLLEKLTSVKDIYTQQDFVSTKRIENLRIEGRKVHFEVVMPYPAKDLHALLQEEFTQAAHLAGAQQVYISFRLGVITHGVQKVLKPLPEVRNIIAVASGKGGVGKSTTTVNLALALAAQGASVGILDGDIYGPSLPLLLDIDSRPKSLDGKTMEPLENYAIQSMSMGFLAKKDDAMVWRGPMAVQALEQMLRQTNWRDLDYLFIDTPPGTGDIHLTLGQRVPLTGALIVTTPQDIALLDARKGIRMFEKVGVGVLGLVENMALHTCSQCGHSEHIFGAGGGQQLSQELGIQYLGGLPLDIRIREHADMGTPTVVQEPTGRLAQDYREIAWRLAAQVALQRKDYSSAFPKISVTQST